MDGWGEWVTERVGASRRRRSEIDRACNDKMAESMSMA
jgi:hypothetical protein